MLLPLRRNTRIAFLSYCPNQYNHKPLSFSEGVKIEQIDYLLRRPLCTRRGHFLTGIHIPRKPFYSDCHPCRSDEEIGRKIPEILLRLAQLFARKPYLFGLLFLCNPL